MAQIKLHKNSTSVVSPLYLPLSGNSSVSGIVDFIDELTLSGERPFTHDQLQSINAGSKCEGFTNLGENKIQVGGVSAHVFHTNNYTGYIYSHHGISVGAGLTAELVAETTNYLVAGWDITTQSPTAFVTTNVDVINESNFVPTLTLFPHNNHIYQLSWDKLCLGLPNRLHRRFVKTQRFARQSGLELTTTETPFEFNISQGILWYGAMDETLSNFNSVSNSAFLNYHSSGVWVEETVTGFNNLYYDDGDGRIEVSNNKFVVNWIYRSVSNGDAHILLGTGDYKLDEALDSQPPPNLPPQVSQFSVLVGRIIIERGIDTETRVDSAFNVLFAPSTITEHNQLIGLLDNDHPQYTLTADMIDYSLTSHTHPYLPLSGGTVTGTTYFTQGLSATTLSGDGSALTNVSGTDVTYLEWRNDSYEPSGFPRPQRWACSYSAATATQTFSVGPTASQYYFWVNGSKVTKTSSESIQWPNITGLHYFYFDENGQLQTTRAFDIQIISKWAYIANIYWNSALSSVVFSGDERHGMIMDPATHEYLHRWRGSVYVSGMQLGDFNLNNNATFSVTNGTFFDEDLEHNIIDGNPQTLSLTAHIPVLSLSGANQEWRKWPATSWPLVLDPGTNRICYNEWTGSIWKQTQVTDNRYMLTHIFATNDLIDQVWAIQGQKQYDSISEARRGAITEISSLVTRELPMAEAVALGTVIYHSKSTYANHPRAAVVATDTGGDYVNWTSTTISPGTNPGDHGQLTGLGDDDHSIYWRIGTGSSSATYRNGWASLSGTLSVSGGIWATTLSGDGSALTGVNAAKLGGALPSAYSLTSHLHSYLPLSGGTVTGQTNFTAGLSANSSSGEFIANSGFVLELRTSDPASPEIGRMWLRTDL